MKKITLRLAGVLLAGLFCMPVWAQTILTATVPALALGSYSAQQPNGVGLVVGSISAQGTFRAIVNGANQYLMVVYPAAGSGYSTYTVGIDTSRGGTIDVTSQLTNSLPAKVVTSGSVSPQGLSCKSGDVYVQTAASGPIFYDCSYPMGYNWVRRDTGDVFAAAITSALPLWDDVYPMTATIGTSVADTVGSNPGTFSGSGIAWAGGTSKGITFSGGYFTLPDNTLLQNGYTYQVTVGTPGATNTFATLLGATNFSALGFDKALRPFFESTNNADPIVQNASVTWQPSTPTTFTFVTDASQNNRVYAGTSPVPAFSQQNTIAIPGNLPIGVGGFTNNGSFPFTGPMYELKIARSQLSDEAAKHEAAVTAIDMAARGVTLNSKWAGVGTNNSLLSAHFGDSLTAGHNSVLFGGYPSYLAQFLNNSLNVMNFGIGSQTCAGLMSSEVPAGVTAYKYFKAQTSVASILCGTNDLPLSSFPNELAATVAPAHALQSAGYKVIQMTIPPKGVCTGQCDLDRQTHNANVIAARQYDGLVDIGSDIRLANPLYNFAFYGSDAIHFTDAYYQLLAGRERTEMNRMKVLSTSDSAPCVAYNATPNFDLSLGLHQCILLTGNVTYFTVSNGNQNTAFTIDFIQDGTGGRTVGSPVTTIGSGATATDPLSGTQPVFTLGAPGTFYKASNPPTIVPSGGTCTQMPLWQVTLSGGAVTGATPILFGNCSVAPTVTLVSTESVWHSFTAVNTTASKVTSQTFHYDSTMANIYANDVAAQ